MRCKDKKKIYFSNNYLFYAPPAGWYKLEGTRDVGEANGKLACLMPGVAEAERRANSFVLPKCSNVDEVRQGA